MIPFLRNPASLRFHHNVQGGLLSHSIAVADLITPVQARLSVISPLQPLYFTILVRRKRFQITLVALRLGVLLSTMR